MELREILRTVFTSPYTSVTEQQIELAERLIKEDQANEQSRVERIFREIEDNFQYYIEGTNDGFIFHQDRWQALKKQEGIES